MASFTFNDLKGGGIESPNLSSGTPYTFTITNNSGSSYFVMETVTSPQTPPNLLGSFTSLSNIASYNQSKYIAGFVLPIGTNEFVFTPDNNIDGTTLKLRGEGGITLSIVP